MDTKISNFIKNEKTKTVNWKYDICHAAISWNLTFYFWYIWAFRTHAFGGQIQKQNTDSY